MAKLIKVGGQESEILPANGKQFTLEELQKIVGGYIEHLDIPPGSQMDGYPDMFLNEDGKAMNLEYNPKATHIARHAGIATTDYIVGDAIFCTPTEAGAGEEELYDEPEGEVREEA